MEYIYLGDRHTATFLKKQFCKAVRRTDGKCIRGKNGSMLVEFECKGKAVVTGRLLRRISGQVTFQESILHSFSENK